MEPRTIHNPVVHINFYFVFWHLHNTRDLRKMKSRAQSSDGQYLLNINAEIYNINDFAKLRKQTLIFGYQKTFCSLSLSSLYFYVYGYKPLKFIQFLKYEKLIIY